MICVFKSFEEKVIFKFKEGVLFILLFKKIVCIIKFFVIKRMLINVK